MELINSILWGRFTIALILICGIYHTVKSGFVQLRFAKHLKCAGRSGFRSVMSSLAASMGTGNITGCSAAIAAGGAGAVFWMWISAFTGMALAYRENRLGGEYAEKYRDPSKGPMLYIEKGTGSKKLALVYAAACLAAALAMGCMSQTSAMAEAAENINIPPLAVSVIAAIAAGAVIFSSKKAAVSAMNAAEKLVPLMGLLYVSGCTALIIMSGSSLTELLGRIISEAFTFEAASGGILGTGVSKAVSIGLRRGIFSNEAGMGSSVLVHTEGKFGSPEEMGCWAAFEVFLDTIVCCTLTALAIMSTGKETLSKAFSLYFGEYGGGFVFLCVCLFAWAAVLGWCCYGEKCLDYLTNGRKSTVPYKVIFCLCAAFAGLFPSELLFGLSDIINVFLILPNLLAITILTITDKQA